jgi:KaiC/GvpD/RAD55 family RecA-like ATPase
LDKPIVVTGPPGTGKTVIAFYRAENAAKAGQRPQVVMFNNVLQRPEFRYLWDDLTEDLPEFGLRKP